MFNTLFEKRIMRIILIILNTRIAQLIISIYLWLVVDISKMETFTNAVTPQLTEYP